MEDGTKLGDYKFITPATVGSVGAVGGGAASGGATGAIFANVATVSTAGAASGGVAIGGALVGVVAYGSAKKFGWYEINCSINEQVRTLKTKVNMNTAWNNSKVRGFDD